MAPWITVLSRHTVFTKRVIYYKFTFVCYSVKQGITHRPTSYLVHLYTVPFLWLREEHRQQCSWVDFAGQCLLWDFCWGLLLLLLLFLFFFFLKIVFNIASHSTWFWVGVSNQNFTDGFLLKSPSQAIALYPQSSALFRLLCITAHSCRNVNTSQIWKSSTVTAKEI